MADLTTYMMNIVINRFLRNQAFTPPTTVYIGLHKSDPGVAGSDANEISKTGYARQAITLSAGSGGATANTNLITFGPAGEAWDEATHFAIHDLVAAGNQMANDALPTPKTLANGESGTVAVGELDLAFTGDYTTYMANKIIDHCFRNQSYTPAAAVYGGLHTSDPGVGGSDSNELTGNGYIRKAVTVSAPSGGVSYNSSDITFGPATPSGWSAATYGAVHDAVSSGNQLMNDALGSTVTVAAGESAKFASGDLDFSVA